MSPSGEARAMLHAGARARAITRSLVVLCFCFCAQALTPEPPAAWGSLAFFSFFPFSGYVMNRLLHSWDAAPVFFSSQRESVCV